MKIILILFLTTIVYQTESYRKRPSPQKPLAPPPLAHQWAAGGQVPGHGNGAPGGQGSDGVLGPIGHSHGHGNAGAGGHGGQSVGHGHGNSGGGINGHGGQPGHLGHVGHIVKEPDHEGNYGQEPREPRDPRDPRDPRQPREPVWEQPEPQPEKLCKVLLPPKPKNAELSPYIITEMTVDSEYPCDVDSKVRRLSYHKTGKQKVTCNGIIYSKGQDSYDAVFYSKYGKHIEETLNLTDYSQVMSWNNGNLNYIECGTITGGHCNGDTLWGWGIYHAEDKDGCAKGGNVADISLARSLEIIGKCASKCALGLDVLSYSPAITNKGLDSGFIRNLDESGE